MIKLELIPESRYSQLDGIHPAKGLIEETTEKMIEISKIEKGSADMTRLLDGFSLEAIEKYCESEIEKQLAYGLLFHAKMEGVFAAFIPQGVYTNLFMREKIAEDILPLMEYYRNTDLLLVPNFAMATKKSKKIRVDFLVSYKPNKGRRRKFFIIECDSFMYHSSQGQLMNDKKRERSLMATKIPIIRFAGGEIHKNAFKVGRELLEYCFG